ncbi:coenzyme A biosynthesis bifunctional protein coaBC [Candidatus Nitrososphaera gargensis Ga9.2]|uniref:Coenzyme A biosynthesis bifunctional protein CoaBC n=2 Tax=Candidatus Nitrososphaera gargensis TaxID=497727 RepID=K0IE45_NITGG|nr:coenzyme A biosynthesis bifunctional protein coaBC [Candidatus Nitrososphaera gargensis Ga9.2]
MRVKRGSHPSKDIVGSDGNELGGKKIVLCITGSVAAYRAIDLARLLMRHGADVHAVMTESTASTLLHLEMMKWATGNDVVTKLTGNLEHVMLADYGMSDLIIVYPCTANTLGKMVAGIDDTPVTSVLSVALGSKIPIIIAPAMHEAMYENKFIRQNIDRLRGHITFVEPTMEEGKAKVAEPRQVLDAAVAILSGGRPLAGKRVLVTAGSTVEHIDPIRIVTNTSSGKMGIAIAHEAERMGADVTLVYGHGSEPADEKAVRVNTSEEMYRAVISELSSKKYDIAIMAAAVADFTPARKSEKKLDTRAGRMELSLVATRKIIDEVKKRSKGTFLVAFKADYDVPDSVLVEKAYKKLHESDADIVVANDLGRKGSEAGSDKNQVFIVDKKKRVVHLRLESKQAIARKLLELVAQSVNGKDGRK